MAELNTGDSGGGKGKVRSKKANAKVDLTAMVDLAFLLITFFMLTTTLSKPQSMDLPMPDKNKDSIEIKVEDARTLTVIIGPKNQLKYYMGRYEQPIEAPAGIAYGKNGIRKKIMEKKGSVPIFMQNPKKGLIMLIKASKKSTYKNLVDILDEVAICKVPTYAIVDITKDEENLFEK
jgi:biopolymer transport protein ExbD